MISLLLMLAAQSASDKLPRAQALPPPTDDEQAVLNSANGLLAAFKTGNSAEIMRWVYPDGRDLTKRSATRQSRSTAMPR